MAISPFKTFSPGEILTAADLNSSFSHITSNGQSVGFPRTSTADFDGQTLTLDADGDTSLAAGSDDILILTMQGQQLFQWDGDVASAVNGIEFIGSATGSASAMKAWGSDTNLSLEIGPKGTGDLVLYAGGSETDLLVTAGGSGSDVQLKLRGKGSSKVALGDADLLWPDADGTSGQLLSTNGSGTLSFTDGGGVPQSGDRLAFQQTTPSAGYTKDTGIQNDCAMRLVTGTAGSDLTGSVFTTAFGSSRTTGNQSASHTHNYSFTTGVPSATLSVSSPNGGSAGNSTHTHSLGTTATGTQSASHTHTLNMAVDYYDFVIGEVT